MITTGVIRRINIDSDNHAGNKVIAEISLFKNPSSTNPEDYSCECNCVVPGGIYSPYNVGDKVYISFLNDKKSHPIILGKIYQGLEEEKARSFAYFNKLKVEAGAELPENTKIGSLEAKDIVNLKTQVSILEAKVASLESLINEILDHNS